jgi:hypothetical protein
MANSEHVAKIYAGVTTWNKWREDNPVIIPDLKEANLSGQLLQGDSLWS